MSCSREALADVDSSGPDEQVAAEGGGEQHAFAPLAWERQNDVFERNFEAGAVEHDEFAFARVDFKRNAIQKSAVDAVAVQTGGIDDDARANRVASPVRIARIHAPMTLGLALDRTVYSAAILANDAAVC